MEIKVILGRVLKQVRQEKNMTQSQLAETCKLDLDYIGKIERGKRQPSISTLFKIADALDIPVADILQSVEKQRS